MGDGKVICDGKVIYVAENLKVGLFQDNKEN